MQDELGSRLIPLDQLKSRSLGSVVIGSILPELTTSLELSPLQEPPAPVQPADDKPVVSKPVGNDSLLFTMGSVFAGLLPGNAIQLTYDDDGTARSAECKGSDDVDIIIDGVHNSPYRMPAVETASAALAEMQRTGKYPTLEDQLSGKGPLGEFRE